MIPYVVGKFAPNSSYLNRGLVNSVLYRVCFRAVSSQNGDKIVTSPPPSIVERVSSPLEGIKYSQCIVNYWPCCRYSPTYCLTAASRKSEIYKIAFANPYKLTVI